MESLRHPSALLFSGQPQWRQTHVLLSLWKVAFHARQQVVSQEETTQWVLHAPAHLDKVFKDVLDRVLGHINTCCHTGLYLFGFDVDGADSHKEVKTRHNVASVLHQFVQVAQLHIESGNSHSGHANTNPIAFLEFIDQVHLQMTQLISNGHV